MSTRETILSRIRSQKRSVRRSAVSHEIPGLVEDFTTSLQAAKGEVIKASSLQNAIQKFKEFCREVNANRIVLNGDSPLDDYDLPSTMPDCEWFVVGQTEGDLRSFCASADIGVTGVDAALAQTGSIVVGNGARKSRMTTLLPTIHAAFVPVSCLLPDIFHWTAQLDKRVPTSLMLISGPSKTADIERVLTVGVHGPKRLVVFLYDD